MQNLNVVAQHRAAELVGEAHKLLGAIASGEATPAALRSAAADAIAQIFGAPPSAAHHPLAAGLARGGLRHIAASLSQSDFGAAFQSGLTAPVMVAYATSANHRKITHQLEVPDFNGLTTSIVDQGFDDPALDDPTIEHGEGADVFVVGDDGEVVTLTRKTLTVRISPELMRNDAVGAVAYVLANFAVHGARREKRRVFGAIVANPILADTRTLYNGVDGNDLGVGTTLSLTNLEKGCAAMYRQKTRAGNELGAAPRYLVVGPELQLGALSLVKQITIDGQAAPLEVIVATEIPAASTAWYLFADPVVAPVVGFGVLRGSQGRTINTRTRVDFRSSAPEVALDHTYGAAVLSRVGTVRGGV